MNHKASQEPQGLSSVDQTVRYIRLRAMRERTVDSDMGDLSQRNNEQQRLHRRRYGGVVRHCLAPRLHISTMPTPSFKFYAVPVSVMSLMRVAPALEPGQSTRIRVASWLGEMVAKLPLLLTMSPLVSVEGRVHQRLSDIASITGSRAGKFSPDAVVRRNGTRGTITTNDVVSR